MQGSTIIEPVAEPLLPPSKPGASAEGDASYVAPPARPSPPPSRALHSWVVIVVILLIACAAIAISVGLRRRSPTPSLEASGTVEATDAMLGFAAPGRISAIALREGEVAQSGAVLAALDTSELMAHLRQLRDARALALAQLRDLEAGSRPQELEDRRQVVVAARRSLDDAELDLRRMTALESTGAVSEQVLDKTKLARDVAATQYAQAQAALSLAQEGARREQIAAARAVLASAESQLGALEATIPNYFIRAPWSGVVTDRAHEPGEAVSAGMAVLTVMNPDDRWVRIFIPEDQVGAVHLGQRASITSDAFPTRGLSGHIRWISNEAEFTPKNVQTKDDRVRLVYAAKVQIDGDTSMVLKPGTPADVRVEIGGKR